MSSVRQLALGTAGVVPGAIVSDCGVYRYRLWRRWGSGAHVLWVMLNPSRADATCDDQTIRKCTGFAKRWGYEAIEVVNLFAYRSAFPEDVASALRKGRDVVGPMNDTHIQEAVRAAPLVVAAWGSQHWLGPRAAAVWGRLGPARCLGKTKDGHPRHPVMLAYATKLEAL